MLLLSYFLKFFSEGAVLSNVFCWKTMPQSRFSFPSCFDEMKKNAEKKPNNLYAVFQHSFP